MISNPKYEKIIYDKLMSSKNERALKRYYHSLGVAESAVELVERFNLPIDPQKAYLTGLLHDYAKFENDEKFFKIAEKYHVDIDLDNDSYHRILHAILGCYIVKEELGVIDEDMFNAIKNHTSGRANMSDLEEVIFVSDCIEKNRKGETFSLIRDVAKDCLKEAVALEAKIIIEALRSRGEKIHPSVFETYENYKKYLRR